MQAQTFRNLIKRGKRITEVIEQLVEESGKREERIKVLFATAACKASIKAGEKLSYESMREIVEELRNAKILSLF